MKYYIDYYSRDLICDREEDWYQTTDRTSKLSILIKDNISESFNVIVEFLRSDNRRTTLYVRDTFAYDESKTETYNGDTYNIYNFTLTKDELACAGPLQFTVYINFLNSSGSVKRTACLLNGVNTVMRGVTYDNGDYLYYANNTDGNSVMKSFVNSMYTLLNNQKTLESQLTDITSDFTAVNTNISSNTALIQALETAENEKMYSLSADSLDALIKAIIVHINDSENEVKTYVGLVGTDVYLALNRGISNAVTRFLLVTPGGEMYDIQSPAPGTYTKELTGMVKEATMAVADMYGNDIANTYAKKTDIPSIPDVPVSVTGIANAVAGKNNVFTFTYVKSDNSTSTFSVTIPTASYSNATSTADGLMSKEDKVKLDGIDSTISTKVAEETTARVNAVNAINELIPSQASDTNQLADKAFVNSSIATATASFKGTFTSVDDLPTTGVDDNDYAFIKNVDSHGNVTSYDRYKYTGSAWEFEYTLNNSSFTEAQWSAINSGITSEDKTTIDALESTYVKQESGKGLSSNDFTTDEKNKLAGLNTVIANPTGATNSLTSIQIGDDLYNIEGSSSGGGTDVVMNEAVSGSNATDVTFANNITDGQYVFKAASGNLYWTYNKAFYKYENNDWTVLTTPTVGTQTSLNGGYVKTVYTADGNKYTFYFISSKAYYFNETDLTFTQCTSNITTTNGYYVGTIYIGGKYVTYCYVNSGYLYYKLSSFDVSTLTLTWTQVNYSYDGSRPGQARFFWQDGNNNIYFSQNAIQYKLDASSTEDLLIFISYTWTNKPNSGIYIWHDLSGNTYWSYGTASIATTNYKLIDGDFVEFGIANNGSIAYYSGTNVWNDGTNIYATCGSKTVKFSLAEAVTATLETIKVNGVYYLLPDDEKGSVVYVTTDGTYATQITVDGTAYDLPTGGSTVSVTNTNADNTVSELTIDGSVYAMPKEIVANPSGDIGNTLSTIQIGDVLYNIASSSTCKIEPYLTADDTGISLHSLANDDDNTTRNRISFHTAYDSAYGEKSSIELSDIDGSKGITMTVNGDDDSTENQTELSIGEKSITLRVGNSSYDLISICQNYKDVSVTTDSDNNVTAITIDGTSYSIASSSGSGSTLYEHNVRLGTYGIVRIVSTRSTAYDFTSFKERMKEYGDSCNVAFHEYGGNTEYRYLTYYSSSNKVYVVNESGTLYEITTVTSDSFAKC